MMPLSAADQVGHGAGPRVQVGGDDLADMGGEVQRLDAAAGAQVEGRPRGLRMVSWARVIRRRGGEHEVVTRYGKASIEGGGEVGGGQPG